MSKEAKVAKVAKEVPEQAPTFDYNDILCMNHIMGVDGRFKDHPHGYQAKTKLEWFIKDVEAKASKEAGKDVKE